MIVKLGWVGQRTHLYTLNIHGYYQVSVTITDLLIAQVMKEGSR